MTCSPRTPQALGAALLVGAMAGAELAAAQPVGTFRWQTQPYCNVLILSVTAVGSAYRLEGRDDQCGGTPASVIGMAYQTPSGAIGVGLTVVGPNAQSVHLDATVLVNAGFSGTWRDSIGRSGTWFFTPGAGTGGSPRPLTGVPLALYGATLQQPASGADRGLSVTVGTDTGTAGDAAAVFGQFGGSTGFTAPGSAGVRGDSAELIGVMGTTNSGWGVVGGAGADGIAVQGYAEGANSVGVHAVHAAGGTALDVNNGAIKVSGAVRPAFVWTVPPADHLSSCTNIDHPLTNGDPNAILFVTYRSIDVSKYFTVGYRGDIQRWRACTGVAMGAGNQLGVLVIKQ